MKIYIVSHYGGQYEDSYEHIDFVTDNEEYAKLYVDNSNSQLKVLWERLCQAENDLLGQYEGYEEEADVPAEILNKLDKFSSLRWETDDICEWEYTAWYVISSGLPEAPIITRGEAALDQYYSL